MDVVAALADRLETQTLCDLISRHRYTMIPTVDIVDDCDSGTASDDENAADLAADTRQIQIHSAVGVPSTTTWRPPFFAVTSSPDAGHPAAAAAAAAVINSLSFTCPTLGATFRPVRADSCPGRWSPAPTLDAWSAAHVIDCAYCSDSSLSSSSGSSRLSDADAAEDPDTSARRPPACDYGSGGDELDEEIRTILRAGSSSASEGHVPCALCDVTRHHVTSASSNRADVTSQLQRRLPRSQRPSLNLYKMQKLRIGRKQHCRKMSLAQHKPRPHAVTSPKPGSCLPKHLQSSGGHVPAYYFRSLSYIRSAMCRMSTGHV